MTDLSDILRRLAVYLGWAALFVILFATLSPIDIRPHVPDMSADTERFLAYFLAGGLLCYAYPRQRWLVLGSLAALALGLEWLQTLEVTRHGRPHDAVVKLVGSMLGGILAMTFDYMTRRLRRPA